MKNDLDGILTDQILKEFKAVNPILKPSSIGFVVNLIDELFLYLGKSSLTAESIIENIDIGIFECLDLSYFWRPALEYLGILSFKDLGDVLKICVKFKILLEKSDSNLKLFQTIDKEKSLFGILQYYEDTKLKKLIETRIDIRNTVK